MYRQPEQSPIERQFWANAKTAIPDLEQEVQIGKYRVDFLVRRKKIVVELYGFKWHNSKEKITRDAERERFLQRQGYRIVRFTGSEIYKNSRKCVNDLLDIMRTVPDTEAPRPPISKLENKGSNIQFGTPSLNPQFQSTVLTSSNRNPGSKTLLGLNSRQILILLVLVLLNTGVLFVAAILLFGLAR